MAIPMRTFGNTLSELQAGTNAAQGLDYQRANAQDAINQARLQAFLQLQGQKLQTEARQNELAASRAQRMAELLQQTEANRELARMDAASRLEVAKTMAEGRVDPKVAGLKLELQQEETENRALSEARKKIVDEMRVLERAKDKEPFDWGDPNDIGARWTSTRYGQLRDALGKIDAVAVQRQLALHPDGWIVGYEGATPVINQGANVVTPPAAVPVIPVTPAPAPTGAAYMGLGGMLPSTANRTLAPVPPMFSTPAPALRPQSGGGTNYFDFSNGTLVPR